MLKVVACNDSDGAVDQHTADPLKLRGPTAVWAASIWPGAALFNIIAQVNDGRIRGQITPIAQTGYGAVTEQQPMFNL